ncbi:MAG: PAS domain S-box protein [Anaerolineae bacterium]|nr:PAS domain S-box protein [Anaerolineae bacterium]
MLTTLFAPRTIPFEGVLLFIISFTAVISLIPLKKSKPILLLLAFFGCMAILGMIRIVEGTVVGLLFTQLEDTCIILGGVFLVQFAYHFPVYDQPREARLLLGLYIMLTLVALGTIFGLALEAYRYPESLIISPEYFWYLNPLAILLAIGLCLRRALYYAGPAQESAAGWPARLGHALKALWQPPNKRAASQRNLALAILVGTFQALPSIGLVTGIWINYMVAIGGLLTIASIALVFYNHTIETISFNTKLMGISLTALLIFMGIAGLHAIETTRSQQKDTFNQEFQMVQDAIVGQTESANAPPADVSYIISWSGPTDFQLNNLDIHYLDENLQPDAIAAIQGLGGSVSAIDNGDGKVHRFAGTQFRDFYRRRFALDGRIYEVGFPWLAYAQPILSEVNKYILLTTLGSLLILLFFPFFFQRHLFTPLDNLLQGVKKADKDQLDTRLPVFYEDEIGTITHSFNRMMASLRQSNSRRDQYYAELIETNAALKKEIQERQYTQLALSESEKKYRAVVEQATEGIIIVQDYQRKYFNPAYLEITGYSAAAYEALPFMALVYADDVDAAKNMYQKMLMGQGLDAVFEYRIISKSGQIKWLSTRATTIEWEGKPAGMVFVQDITQRKQMEIELRQHRDELEERVAERTHELASFIDLSMLFAESGSLNDVLEVALNRIYGLEKCQAVALHLATDDQADLTLMAQYGLSSAQQQQLQPLPLEPALSNWLAHRQEALLALDSPTTTRLSPHVWLEGFSVYLGVQVRARDHIQGILSYYRVNAKPFSMNEILLLAALGENLGIIIENHRLRSHIEEIAIVAERQRLARDLHDSITQSLYSVSLFSHAARESVEDDDTKRLNDSLGRIEEIALTALKEMRLLLYQLQSDVLAEKGLGGALKSRFDSVERRLGIAVDYQESGQRDLPPDLAEALYKAAMEALNNSLKHAGATHVTVRLSVVEPVVELSISDNGRGFAPEQSSRGMGLQNIRERLAQLNGRLKIASVIGAGTTIELAVRADDEPVPVGHWVQ